MSTGTAAVTARAPRAFALKCIHCGAELVQSTFQIGCSDCGSQWPIVGGIPRFYQPGDYYWGEISRQEARDLLTETRRSSWHEAVRSHVQRSDLQDYYFDLQRASWLTLLDLETTAVALDIGCGYGALTHSLALSIQHVYGVEAVPDRIEFTRERLRQEGVTNVSLFQASATNLPFFENSFDLVVVNGILEWIGEWDPQGSPHAAQLRFLSSVRRLLKEDGFLVIGIENRFGPASFHGALDHSGMPYTNLVPRRLATTMLRRNSGHGQYAFWTPNSKREYRTYTYSGRGYRRLLSKAGFANVSLYWAYPGYNQPHHLIPLDSSVLTAEHYRRLGAERDRFAKRPWRIRARGAVAGWFPWFVNHYVIICSKSEARRKEFDSWLKARLYGKAVTERSPLRRNSEIYRAVYTRPFSNKSVLRLWSPDSGRIGAIAKVSLRNGRYRGDENVTVEYTNLLRVREKLPQRAALSVPEPMGYLRRGETAYTVESLAPGRRFEEFITHERYSGNTEAVREDFSKLIKAGVDLAKVLQTLENVPPIDPAWLRIPDEIASDAAFCKRVTKWRYFSEPENRSQTAWIQHGDFVAGNIFVQENPERYEVVDWSDLAGGFPPLYDIFTLIIQAGLSAFAHEKRVDFGWWEHLWMSFSELFLESSDLARIFDELLAEACERINVQRSLLPSLLVEFLVIRTHYNRARHEPNETYVRMLRAYLDKLEGRGG